MRILLPLIVIVLALITMGVIVAIQNSLKTAPPVLRFQRTLWVQVSILILVSTEAWMMAFADSSIWLVVLMAAVSAVGAVFLLATVTNWHGWSKRLAFRLKPLYCRQRNPQLRRAVLIVAPLALLSDVVLLIVLLSR